MKKLLPILLLLLCSNAYATTYYASPSGGGAASCVDSGANVCSIQRAVTVAAAGTNTIECATGTYNISTTLTFNGTNTGANLTIQKATGATPIFASSGSTTVVDITAAMISGTITFNGITIDDGSGSDYSIRNAAPEVNVVFKNGTCNNTDATAGNCLNWILDSTNQIGLTSGEDTVTNIKTGATTNVKIAQKIVPAANITVNRIAFKLQRKCGNQGTTCDEFVSGESWDYRNAETLTYTIETDSAGAPSGTPVTNGTATTIRAFDTAYKSDQWTPASFASNVSLTSGTTYWLVLTGSYTASASNYITASTDTGNGYAGGDCSTYNGTSWSGCSAGKDLLFSIDRAHTRTLTVQDSVFTTRSSCAVIGWSDSATFQRNTFTPTAAGALSFSSNGYGTVVGPQLKKVLIEGNAISVTNSASLSISIGTSAFATSYIETVIVKDNTGTIEKLMQPNTMVRRVWITGNTFDITYTGNNPFQFGKEVDGTDPQEINENPFEQIVIEGNRFNYTGASHNHLLGLFMGADNGVLRNNTFITSGTGGWGIVTKGDNWLIDHNNLVNVSPGIAVVGGNNTRVLSNTIYCLAETTDGCLLVRTHQDSVYGGKHGLPLNSYIRDNIVYHVGSTKAAYDWGTSTDLGPGRTTQYWSVMSDYNIYYAPNSSNRQATILAPGGTEDVTSAEGIATVQSTFQNSTYTDSTSLSYYNDQHSYLADPRLASPTSANFKATGANVRSASVPNTSIGSYQSSGGRKWVGRGVN